MVIHNNTPRDTAIYLASDSLAADSMPPMKSYNPACVDLFGIDENPFAESERSTVTSLPEGRKGEPLNNTPLNDAGCMALVMLVFFFLAISFRNGSKYVSDIAHHMFSVRKRQNAFESHTMSETQVMITLLANTSLMIGLLFYIGIGYFFPSHHLSEHVFTSVGALTLLSGAFTVLQLGLYHVLGYVFAHDSIDTKLWIDGFKSSQSLLGLILFPIVFIILLYPATTQTLLYCSIFLYFCSRLVFISKGFRIFFNNFSSCVYFILYLCTVEIVPVFLMCLGAIYLSEII